MNPDDDRCPASKRFSSQLLLAGYLLPNVQHCIYEIYRGWVWWYLLFICTQYKCYTVLRLLAPKNCELVIIQFSTCYCV